MVTDMIASDASTRYLLNRGARLTELLKQPQFTPYVPALRHHISLTSHSMPTEIMAPLIYAGVNGLLDKVPVDKISEWERSLYVRSSHVLYELTSRQH